jgi:hypothetical protein
MGLGTSGFLYGRFSEISSKIQVKHNLQTGLMGVHCMGEVWQGTNRVSTVINYFIRSIIT